MSSHSNEGTNLWVPDHEVLISEILRCLPETLRPSDRIAEAITVEVYEMTNEELWELHKRMGLPNSD